MPDNQDRPVRWFIQYVAMPIVVVVIGGVVTYSVARLNRPMESPPNQSTDNTMANLSAGNMAASQSVQGNLATGAEGPEGVATARPTDDPEIPPIPPPEDTVTNATEEPMNAAAASDEPAPAQQ